MLYIYYTYLFFDLQYILCNAQSTLLDIEYVIYMLYML